MVLSESAIDVVNKYFDDPKSKEIIAWMEDVRGKAYDAKRWFYKKYRLVLVLAYIVVFFVLPYVDQYIEGWIFFILVGPWRLFWRLWKQEQSWIIKSNRVSTKLFSHFIASIFADSTFNEGKKLYTQDPSTSHLFMENYDETSNTNSLLIPLCKNTDGWHDIEIQWVEAYFSRTEWSGKHKHTIVDMGMLYRIIISHPRRIIKSPVTIVPNNDSWFASKGNNVPLEDKEFEEHFDVQSDDPLEARMILTSNVMYHLTQFIKQSSATYTFRFIDNSFYIKRKLDSSFIAMDRDSSIIDNKQIYVDFYDEMMQTQKLIEALNVDYYNKSI